MVEIALKSEMNASIIMVWCSNSSNGYAKKFVNKLMRKCEDDNNDSIGTSVEKELKQRSV